MSSGDCTPVIEIPGYGAVWQYCDPLTDEFVTFAGSRDVDIVGRETEALDTTSGDGDDYETMIPSTLKKLNSTSIEGNYLQSQWQRLADMFEAGTITRWRFVITQIASQPTTEFCAFIQAMDASFPLRDLATNEITIQPSGRPSMFNLVS